VTRRTGKRRVRRSRRKAGSGAGDHFPKITNMVPFEAPLKTRRGRNDDRAREELCTETGRETTSNRDKTERENPTMSNRKKTKANKTATETKDEATKGKTTHDESNVAKATTAPAPEHDANNNGADADNLIKGDLLKFTNDYKWLTDTAEVIPPDRKLMVWEVIKATQKWGEEGVAPTVVCVGEWRAYRLNAEVPKSEWRAPFGELIGPYEDVFAVYLYDPAPSMAIFTFVTGSKGGKRACSKLQERMYFNERVQGPNFRPRVSLTDVPFPTTKWGIRQRPHFVVEKFVPLAIETDNSRPLLDQKGAQAQPTDEPEPDKSEKKKKPAPPFDDDIPI
jgi:hypothetical protein